MAKQGAGCLYFYSRKRSLSYLSVDSARAGGRLTRGSRHGLTAQRHTRSVSHSHGSRHTGVTHVREPNNVGLIEIGSTVQVRNPSPPSQLGV